MNSKENFEVFMPIKLAKSVESGEGKEPDMIIAGIASTDDKDREGDNVDQVGLNVKPFLDKGFLNYDHDDEKLVGIPIPDECKFTDRGFFVTAKLLPNKLGREIYENAKALESIKSDRCYGFSVQGTIDERHPVTKRVVKATVYHLAITPTPQNPECSWEVLQKSFAGYQTPIGEINSGESTKSESLEKDAKIQKYSYKDFALLAESDNKDELEEAEESLKHAKLTKENGVKLLLLKGLTLEKSKELVNFIFSKVFSKGGFNMIKGKDLIDQLGVVSEELKKSLETNEVPEEVTEIEDLEKSKKTEETKDGEDTETKTPDENPKGSEISEGSDDKVEETNEEEKKDEENKEDKKDDETKDETTKKEEKPEDTNDEENLEKSKDTNDVTEDVDKNPEANNDPEELIKSLMTQPAIQAIANLVIDRLSDSLNLVTPMAKSIKLNGELNVELYRGQETLAKSVENLTEILNKSITQSGLSLEAIQGISEEVNAIKEDVKDIGRTAHLRKSIGSTTIVDKDFNESAGIQQQPTTLSKAVIASTLLQELQSGNSSVTVNDVMTAEAGGTVRPEMIQLVKSKMTGKI